jgi:hypothetical protein
VLNIMSIYSVAAGEKSKMTQKRKLKRLVIR